MLTLYWVVTFNRSTPQANGINVWYAAFLSGGTGRGRTALGLGPGAQALHALRRGLRHDHDGVSHRPGRPSATPGTTPTCWSSSSWPSPSPSPTRRGWPTTPSRSSRTTRRSSATGLAVWGWILRITVALSFLVLPHVITTSTVLVDNQNAATTLQADRGGPALLALGDGLCHDGPRPTRSSPTCGPRASQGPRPWPRCSHTLQHDPQPARRRPWRRAGCPARTSRVSWPTSPWPRRSSRASRSARPRSSPRWAFTPRTWPACCWPSRSSCRPSAPSPGEWKRWWTVCLLGQAVFAVAGLLHAGALEPAGGPPGLRGARAHGDRGAGQAGQRAGRGAGVRGAALGARLGAVPPGVPARIGAAFRLLGTRAVHVPRMSVGVGGRGGT